MHCSQKTFHLLSVSNDPTSILSNISVILWKEHETIFEIKIGVFLKNHKYLQEMFLRRLRDFTE